jgi:hypothetical protein
MKTLQDLFELVAKAIEQNNDFTSNDWFINYSGHVNQLSVRYYYTGWSTDAHAEKVDFKLDDDGIQGAYWFIKTRLK